MTETALAAAFERAGLDVSKDLLANFCFDLLRETPDANQAARRLAYQFERQPNWFDQALREVRDHDNLRLQVALYYLERRRLDMRGKGTGGRHCDTSNSHTALTPGQAGKGHQSSATNGRSRDAFPHHDRRDGHHIDTGNGQREIATPDRDIVSEAEAITGLPQQGHDALAPASLPEAGVNGPKPNRGQSASAPASSKVDRQREANIRAGERICTAVLTALQTKLRDGVLYGEVKMAHLRERARSNRFEAVLCDKTLAHVGGRWPDGACVRDCINEQTAGRLIAEARLEVETAHAA
jgi:hypothetical protein